MNSAALYLTVQPHTRERYWLTRILDGVGDYAAERHLSIVHIDPADIPRGQPLMIIGTTDAYLAEQTYRCEAQGGVPLLVNAHIPSALHGRSSVSFDLSLAVRDCVRHLASQGCRRLLLVGCNASSGADRMKRRVCFAEGGERSLTVMEAVSESGRLCDAVELAVGMVERGETDGLLCANDTVAILLLCRLHKVGVHVPPLIGMGNSHLGRRTTPPLASVDFDYYLLGCEAAAAYTYPRASGSSGAFVQVLLPTRLVLRASAGEMTPTVLPRAAEADDAEDTYFSGERTELLLRLESCLQQMDAIACELLLSASEGYAALSERLFLSERTLKYRMKHILMHLGIENKRALAHQMRAILSSEGAERDDL